MKLGLIKKIIRILTGLLFAVGACDLGGLYSQGRTVGLFSLENGEMFEGDLDKKMRGFVTNFILYYKEQLIEMWEKQEFTTLRPIE